MPAGFQGPPPVLQPSCPFSSPFCAHFLPLFVPIFSRSVSSSPNAHSRPCAVTFPVGTVAFSASHPPPTSLGPCLWHSWPLPCASPGDFSLSSCCHCGIWIPANDQVKLPALSQMPTNPMCSMGCRACCSGAGALRCHTAGEDTRTRFALCVQESWTYPWVFQLQT